MQSSVHFIFESSAFPPVAGEDAETNPGIFGRRLSEWLAGQPECRLYVAVSSTDDTATEWQVFAISEFGFLAKVRGAQSGAVAVSKLMAALKAILTASSQIQALREEAA